MGELSLTPAVLKQIYGAICNGAVTEEEIKKATRLDPSVIEASLERLEEAELIAVANQADLRYRAVR